MTCDTDTGITFEENTTGCAHQDMQQKFTEPLGIEVKGHCVFPGDKTYSSEERCIKRSSAVLAVKCKSDPVLFKEDRSYYFL